MNSNGTFRPNNADPDTQNLRMHLETLLQENAQDIRLVDLEKLYTKKFGQSLLRSLLASALGESLHKFVFSQQQVRREGPTEYRIGLKPDPMPDITQSGPVPRAFRFTPYSVSDSEDGDFLAYISHIDQHSEQLFLQAEQHMSHFEVLTEELDMYYSDPFSDRWIIKHGEPGLACVSKYQGIYHRACIEEIHQSHCVVRYVDLGVAESLPYEQIQLKHLLKYFANEPSLAIRCRLVDIDFKRIDNQILPSTYEELWNLCQGGPFFVKFHSQVAEVWHVEIFDSDQKCLNTLLVAKGLAVSHHHQNGKQTVPLHTPGTLLDDYETDDQIRETVKPQVPVTCNNNSVYGDYDLDALSQISPTQQKNSELCFFSKRSTLSVLYLDNSTPKKQNTPPHQSENGSRTLRNRSKNQSQSGGKRLFRSALTALSGNVVPPPPAKERDKYIEWMESDSNEQSLWNNDGYRDALLTYLARIYGQKPHMHRLFMQIIKGNDHLDELDILNQLIQGTQQLPGAEKFLQKWQDSSRIDRRLKDIEFIFKYGCNTAPPRGSPFTVSLFGSDRKIILKPIRSYFDLGCGNGVITAGIGDGLGLTKESVFGGDVFDAKNERITFVTVDERQSTIGLEADCVDLITAFVTLHHVPDVRTTLAELQRIVRPGGYLILREHDSEAAYALTPKYLHFVHAIMMIARVGEFVNLPEVLTHQSSNISGEQWQQQKSRIIQYTKSIHYRTREEWNQEFHLAGFEPVAYLDYGNDGANNPQKLFYGVYQQGPKHL